MVYHGTGKAALSSCALHMQCSPLFVELVAFSYFSLAFKFAPVGDHSISGELADEPS